MIQAWAQLFEKGPENWSFYGAKIRGWGSARVRLFMAQPITTPQHQLLALALAAIHTPRKWHWFGMWPKYEKANTVLLVPIGPLYDHHKATHA